MIKRSLLRILAVVSLVVGREGTCCAEGVTTKRGDQGERSRSMAKGKASNDKWITLIHSSHVHGGGPHFTCVGSLIASEFILTSASCTSKFMTKGSNHEEDSIIAESVCVHQRLNGEEESDISLCGKIPHTEQFEKIGIRERLEHPNYDASTFLNDFALLKLSRPSSIAPVNVGLDPLWGFSPGKRIASISASGETKTNFDGNSYQDDSHAMLDLVDYTYDPQSLCSDGEVEPFFICKLPEESSIGRFLISGSPLYDSDSQLLVGVLGNSKLLDAMTSTESSGRFHMFGRTSSVWPWIRNITCNTTNSNIPDFSFQNYCRDLPNYPLTVDSSFLSSSRKEMELEARAKKKCKSDETEVVIHLKAFSYVLIRIDVQDVETGENLMMLNGHRLPFKGSTRYRECIPRSCYRLRIVDPWGFELSDGLYVLVVDRKRLADSRIDLATTKSTFFGCDNPCTDDEMYVKFTTFHTWEQQPRGRHIYSDLFLEIEDLASSELVVSPTLIGKRGAYESNGLCLPKRCHRLTIYYLDSKSKRDFEIAIDNEVDAFGPILDEEQSFLIGALKNQTALSLELVTDYWAQDISWEILNVDTGEIEYKSTSGDYKAHERYWHGFCLSKDECNLFKIVDSAGDGLFAPYGNFWLTADRTHIIADGSIFESIMTKQINCDETSSPSSTPLLDCDENEISFRLEILTDSWGKETSWELKDVMNDQVIKRNEEYGNNILSEVASCLPRRCYQFTIYDSNHDGMVDGKYKIYMDGRIVGESNTNFGHKSIVKFGCAPCEKDTIPAYVELLTGSYSGGTSLEVIDMGSDAQLVSENHISDSDVPYRFNFCISNNVTSCTQLFLQDTFGLGANSYQLVVGDESIASGNNYGFGRKIIFGCQFAPTTLNQKYFDQLRSDRNIHFDPLFKSSERRYRIGRNIQKVTVKLDADKEVNLPQDQLFLCNIPMLVSSIETVSGTNNLKTVYDAIAGALMGMHHWNNQNGIIVPDISDEMNAYCPLRFTMEIVDTTPSPFHVIQELSRMISRKNNNVLNPQPCAILEALSSEASSKLTALSSSLDLFQVATTANDLVLNDVEMHPLYARTNPTERGLVIQAVNYLSSVAKTRYFCFIYNNDKNGRRLGEIALHEAKSLNMVVLLLPMSSESIVGIESALQKLQDVGLKFVVNAATREFNQIMEVAIDLECLSDKHFWISFGPFIHLSDLSPRVVAASIGNAILSNVGRYDPYREESDIFLNEWRSIDESDMEYMRTKLPTDLNRPGDMHALLRQDPSKVARYSYDAMIGLGVSACNHLWKSNSLLFDETFSGERHHEEFMNLSFTGASGHLSYDYGSSTSSRDTNGTYYLLSIIEKNTTDDILTLISKPHHYFDIRSKTWKGANPSAVDLRDRLQSLATNKDLSTAFLPVQEETIEEDMNLIQAGVRYTCITMSLISIFTSCFFFIYIIVFSSRKEIRVSQVPFLKMICVGTFLMGLSIIPKSMDDSLIQNSKLLDATCSLPFWFWFMGFVITFSALFSKLWRLNKILQASKTFQRIEVKVTDVLKPFILLFILNVTILTTWQRISPTKYQRIPTLDLVGRRVSSIGMCTYSETDWIPISILLTIAYSALAVACYFAYQTRESKYNESKHIAISMVSISQATVIAVPCIISYRNNLEAELFTFSFATFCICLATTLSLMVPKLMKRKNHLEMVTKVQELYSTHDFVDSTVDSPNNILNKSIYTTSTADSSSCERSLRSSLVSPAVADDDGGGDSLVCKKLDFSFDAQMQISFKKCRSSSLYDAVDE